MEQDIEQVLGYHFKDRSLLEKAFTHSSVVEDRGDCNERMEFLGDSILGMVICQALYEKFPIYNEGELTKIKSMLVSRSTCSKVVNGLGILDHLKIGKGMAGSRALKGSIAAGLLEAIIAAIYFDGGFEAARDFILRSFSSLIRKADAKQSHGNYKSILQQYCQRHMGNTPAYEVLDEKGPDHNKCFESAAVVENRYFKSAWGINKKEAEQKAAFNALVELGLVEGEQEEDSK